jgi:hypothetical protein
LALRPASVVIALVVLAACGGGVALAVWSQSGEPPTATKGIDLGGASDDSAHVAEPLPTNPGTVANPASDPVGANSHARTSDFDAAASDHSGVSDLHTRLDVVRMERALAAIEGGGALPNTAQMLLPALEQFATDAGGVTYAQAAKALLELHELKSGLDSVRAQASKRAMEESKALADRVKSGEVPAAPGQFGKHFAKVIAEATEQHRRDYAQGVRDLLREVLSAEQFAAWSRAHDARLARAAARGKK